MKVLLEFGNKKGMVSRLVLPDERFAQDVAIALTHVLADSNGSMEFKSRVDRMPGLWRVSAEYPSARWEGIKYFVSAKALGKDAPYFTIQLDDLSETR